MSDLAINPGTTPRRDSAAVVPVNAAGTTARADSAATMVRPAQAPGPDPAATANGPGPAAQQDVLAASELPAGGAIHPVPKTPLSLAPSSPAEPMAKMPKQDDGGWKFRFYMGMNDTKYHNSAVKIRSPQLNVDIKDVEWHERKSDSYYNPLTWESAQNAVQWIDEPSNTFTLMAQKNKNEFMVSMFHPKYLLESGQQKEVHGTVEGVQVDGVRPLNGPLNGTDRQPGDMALHEMKNTHRQFEFEVGYGREFTLLRTNNNSSLIYRPAVYAGVMAGHAVSGYGDASWDDTYKVQGVVASVGNKVEFRYKDRISVMAEYKVSGAKLQQGVMGGTATYDMVYTPLTFGVGIKLFDQDNHTRKRH